MVKNENLIILLLNKENEYDCVVDTETVEDSASRYIVIKNTKNCEIYYYSKCANFYMWSVIYIERTAKI